MKYHYLNKFALIGVLLALPFLLQAQSTYEKKWLEVNMLLSQRKPKSAYTKIEEIYALAKQEKNAAQLVKAVIHKLKYVTMAKENELVKSLETMQQEVKTASFPEKPVLHSLLAQIYWQYYRRNRYRYNKRTTLAKKVIQADINTWDLRKITEETMHHFRQSLQEAKKLQNIKVEVIDKVILKGRAEQRKLRPTLYDFLAHQAIRFFRSSEPNLIKPAYQFVIDKPAYLAEADAFVKTNITTKDTASYKFYALTILQDLVRFHLNDTNPEALTDADLIRLKFVYDHLTINNKKELYLQSLRKLEQKSLQTPISTEVSYAIANLIYSNGSLYRPLQSDRYQWAYKKALQKCEEAIKRFPKSRGAKLCQKLKVQILTKSIKLTTEEVNLPNQPFRVSIAYKNVAKLYWRVYKVTRPWMQKNYKACAMQGQQCFLSRLLELKPNHQWQVKLPNDQDYRSHRTETKIPALDLGHYILVASASSGFKFDQNLVASNIITVSNISYIHRPIQAKGITQLYVFDRTTGKPLAGVKVNLKYRKYKYRKARYVIKDGGTYTSNQEGFLTIPYARAYVKRSFWLEFSNGQDWLSSLTAESYKYDVQGGNFQRYKYKNRPRIRTRTFFFLDRKIYRPGQTVYFKGLVLTTKANDHQIRPGYTTQVFLRDRNYQTVGKQSLKTNEFGTFNGSFKIPNNGLNGVLTLYNVYGSIQLSVEDYKRPKFKASFKPVKGNFQVNDIASVTGKAIAYSGAKIDGAKVTYRVVRKASFPSWYSYYYGYTPSSPDMQITKGTTTTNEKGEFTIKFKALPDLSIAKKTRPVFTYHITADVTDINGETHSTTTYARVGYHALVLGVDVPNEVNRQTANTTWEIKTQNLNGQFQAAKGSVVINRLKNPAEVLRKRKWSIPDKFIHSKKEWKKWFPNDPYQDENNRYRWKKGKQVLNVSFATQEKLPDSRQLKVNVQRWKPGFYLLEMKAQDKDGQEIKSFRYFSVSDSSANTIATNQVALFKILNNTAEPGEQVKILVGTAAKATQALLEIEHNNEIVDKRWVKLNKNQQVITIPVKEAYRGNFGVHYTLVHLNRWYHFDKTILVPYTNKQLDISFETFRNKLKPGEKEEWRLKIKGKTGDKIAAEMLATLYDASLDVFRANQYAFNIYKNYYSRMSWQAKGAFSAFLFHNLQDYRWNKRMRYQDLSKMYDRLNLFGYRYGQKEYYVPPSRLRRPLVGSPKTVIGRVVDNNGQGLPGVVVIILGTTIGAATDFDGYYRLNEVYESDVLTFSYIGFQNRRIDVGKNSSLNVKLQEGASLSEVVVTAQGVSTSRRRRRRRKKRKPVVTASRTESKLLGALAGKAAGVQIRGVSTISADEKDQSKLAETKTNVDLSAVKARTNFNETAFFFPELRTNEKGEIIVKFTVPEALTKWKMLGFAHTKDLKYGLTQNELITQKDLMVVPNAPRFFRENDAMVFASKISNISAKNLSGSAQLFLFDALTNQPIDQLMSNTQAQQSFNTKAGQSTVVKWKIKIPEGVQAITYRVVAKAGNFSDGEEMTLPVLTNRMLVTETMPLPIRSNQTKTFKFKKLLASKQSKTLRHHRYTLEFTSNPAWYAVQALPYLMEFPHECAEQTFSRYYANVIAAHIVNSSPKIKQVFDTWKNLQPEALLSNLEKNQELKSLVLSETPWLLQGKDETARKRRVAVLFNLRKMSRSLNKAMNKLLRKQKSNGAWAWFDGGSPSRYITQHIASGVGHLDKLGIKAVRSNYKVRNMAIKAVRFLDQAIYKDYQSLLERVAKGYTKLSDDHLWYMQMQYLYMRSFYKDVPLAKKYQKAFNYYLGQAKEYWTQKNLYMQGMLALSLYRHKNDTTAQAIVSSLRERAIQNEEMGMYWKQTGGNYWYQAPVETQALMVEVFAEVAKDTKAVDDLRTFLLKSKQTQDWKTTRATAEACYALLLQGSNWLTAQKQVEITVGNERVNPFDESAPVKVEAGTGYFKKSWTAQNIRPEMGEVTVAKKDEGVAWGAVYWQYFEQLDKITTAKTPLAIKKQLFLQKMSDAGAVLHSIKQGTKVKVGDLVKVRIEIRVDRLMEYVHMKDMRAAGLEPTSTISRYKWQDGLGYYQSTRDAATHFFFDRLPKGVYVFEYALRVSQAGDFSNGVTTIQCMYAPEFASHSEGVRVKFVEK